jgi:hypothetical protein
MHSGGPMSREEVETEALKLSPQERARLAERLLESLENLSDDENAAIWAEEARRRDAAWDDTSSRPSADVLRDAHGNLKA